MSHSPCADTLQQIREMPATLNHSRSSPKGAPSRVRVTVRDYYRMGEAGLFDPHRRYELLDGDIILMQPNGESHAGGHDWLTRELIKRLGDHHWLRTQGPVRLDNFSEPQPDFAVLKLPKDRYRSAHPGPSDTLLVIEFADSSLGYDIGKKQRAYAKAGIPECWVVDLNGRQLHVFRKPAAAGYANADVLEDGDEVVSSAVKGLRFTVTEMLG
jgi:Uma2 family endonuclease